MDNEEVMAKTVEQVAKALDISITTVRLVLGGKAEQYRISAKTQQRINDYIAENGLVVNHIARSLKLNKTETLGLVIPRLSNLFFSTLAEKLESCCRQAGYQLMIACTYSDSEHEKQSGGRVAGTQCRRDVRGALNPRNPVTSSEGGAQNARW